MKVKLFEIAQPNRIHTLNKGNDSSGPFSKILKESLTEQRRLFCKNLFEQVEQLSQELKRSLTPDGVRRYAKVVTAFMKEAIKQSYELGEQARWDRSGNRTNMIIVKKVNQSLEEMMDLVVNKEKNQIELLAKLDEIRGLLLDLYF